MNDGVKGDVFSTRLGSLPPHIEGKVNGHLSMTVDNIKWRDETHRRVHVCVSWWGEKQKILFIPQIAQVASKNRVSSETTCVYRVMTNTELFLSYLQDCEELHFEVYEQGTNFPLGTATLKNLESIILYNPLKVSCVVTDKGGNEIADLRVLFVFHQNISTWSEFCDVNRRTENILETVHDIEVKETLKNKGENKDCTSGTICVDDLCSDRLQRNRCDLIEMELRKNNGMSMNDSTDVVSNSTISDLLEQCHSIRKEYHNCGRTRLKSNKENIATTEHAIKEYLLGKELSKEEELVALEAVKFSSPSQLMQLAESCSRTFERTDNLSSIKNQAGQNNVWTQELHLHCEPGKFDSCKKQMKDSQNEERRTEVGKHSTGVLFNSQEKHHAARCSRFLRLTIQNLTLNYVGMQRVLVSSRALTSSMHTHNSTHGRQLPPGIVYFVEYEIPQCLRVCSNESLKAKKPWNCNLYRMCSRQKAGKCIHFNRQMVHVLASHKPRFRELLSSSSIKFKVYSRHLNQRLPCFVGEAFLYLGKVVKSYAFNTLQELSVHPQSQSNPSHLLSLGILKVKIEFGSNRTFIEPNPVPSIVTESLASSSESECASGDSEPHTMRRPSKSSKISTNQQDKQISCKNTTSANVIEQSKKKFSKPKLETENKISRRQNDKRDILLFGLLHVSSGREFKISSLYLVSHGFWKEDVMTSDSRWHTDNPNFKFHKIMPVLLSLELLDRCYNNFMVVEVWSQSSLIGITKLPLNQFYIAYRDPLVVEQLLSSKYPIISADGWMNVVDPVSQQHVGQLNILLALGTENQIQMLEMSRCLKEDIVNLQATQASQSLSAELDCTVSRSMTPLNDSGDKEPILILNSREYSQNERDSHVGDNYIENLVHVQAYKSAISKESLFVSCDYSDDYLQKLTSKSTGENVHITEGNSLMLQSSQNSDLLGTENLAACFNKSPVTNGIRQRKFAETSVLQETSFVTNDSQSDSNSFEKLDVCPEQSATQIHQHIISQSCLKYLQTSDDPNIKSNSQRSANEKLSQVSESVSNALETSDNYFSHEDEQLLTRKYNEGTADSIENVEVVNQTDISNIHDYICHYNSGEGSTSVKTLCTPEEISINRKISGHKDVEYYANGAGDVQDTLPNDLYSSLTLGHLDDISENSIDSKNQDANCIDQPDKLSDNSSIAALTENASTQTDILCAENFFAMVEIINALYISKFDNGQLPSCYVTLHTANNSVMSTQAISENTDPVWNWSCEVWLPSTLLGNNGRCLILKVWHKMDDNNEYPNTIEDIVIGFVALDLRVLVCGLPSISGWFNITDLSGSCKGQIQVSVTPLENVSRLLSRKIEQENEIVERRENKDGLKSDAIMKHFLHSVLEKCTEIIPQETVITEKKYISDCVSGDETIADSSIRKQKYPSSSNILNQFNDASCDVDNSPDSNFDSVTSKFNKLTFSGDSQIDSEDHNLIHKTDKQIHSASSGLDELLFSYTNQSGSKPFHCIDDACSSSLTETLRKKLQELDNIIGQMKNRAEHHARAKHRNLISENELRDSASEANCAGHVHCKNKIMSIDYSQGTKLGDSIDSSMQNHNLSSDVKARTLTNKQPEIRACSLHPQNTDSLFCGSSSSDTIPSESIRTNSNIGKGKCTNSRDENIACNSNISDNIVPSDLMTDHLMYEALHEMDLENIFNPLLFQHILVNHQYRSCCPQMFQKTSGSPFSSSENNHTTSLPSNRNKQPFWKTQDYTKILSSISNESYFNVCDRVDSPEVKRMFSRNCVSNDLLHKLTDQTNISSNQIQNARKTFVLPADELCVKPKHLTWEDLSFSECSETQNTDTSLNSPKTNNSRETNCNKKCNTGNNVLLYGLKHSCHKNSDSNQVSYDTATGCQDHKILNVANNSKDAQLYGNYNYELGSRLSVNEHPSKLLTNSSNKAVRLDLSAEEAVLGYNSCERSDMQLEVDRVDSDKFKEQDKV